MTERPCLHPLEQDSDGRPFWGPCDLHGNLPPCSGPVVTQRISAYCRKCGHVTTLDVEPGGGGAIWAAHAAHVCGDPVRRPNQDQRLADYHHSREARLQRELDRIRSINQRTNA